MSLTYDSQFPATAFGLTGHCDATEALSRMGLRLRIAKDEEIYGQDEDADLIYRVVSGAVRTTSLLRDGRRQIGEFYYAGEVFGIEPGQSHRFSAEALCDCEVVAVKASALKAAVGEAAFDRMVWRATSRELDRAQEHVLLLGRKTASERVASFLMDMAERGRAEAVVLPMGRQDMADYLGLTIETVSRTLTQLQNRLVVEFAGLRQFRVNDLGALSRMAA
ncbi:CRP/FNR family nitrogen fixation transcriptional regulator [Caulobacter ginsengisoli]|jgi:CRP/FNR family nitrogen fixation transcriptional regulator|uniref:CRP/FNR family nitrogen fixation transcriptional regulator n=1 Tax=Caulobacter ginsengisoli TaxID=400775 RepID=A0ABU0IVE8_9CAUL|nr:helix-turn-helix domain-containing protein [Caulobacter ginsengisoli]MDQ0465980.1 CRP/FNR family nitrogen fixation transcriptional regulator [Caulobacter ginsengisoli]